MRIRSIKPEFWRSEDITGLPIEDRLLFIGLWSYVDDNGVGKDNVASITADLFAEDLASSPRETLARMHRGLARLQNDGLIARYRVAGRGFLAIVNWTKHQKIDRPSTARYPGPDQAEHEHSTHPRESLASHSRALDEPSMLDQGSGSSGSGSSGTEEQRASAPAPTALVILEPQPTFDDFWNTYPRREDKIAARKTWNRITKTTPPTEILAGATRYANDPNRTPAYTKLPTTWLNAGSWENEPLPTPTTTNDETPAARALRMHAETIAALNEMEASNGNTAWSSRTALGARLA